MFTTQDLAEAGQRLRDLEKKRDLLQGEIDGARAVLRRITKATNKQGFLAETQAVPAFLQTPNSNTAALKQELAQAFGSSTLEERLEKAKAAGVLPSMEDQEAYVRSLAKTGK